MGEGIDERSCTFPRPFADGINHFPPSSNGSYAEGNTPMKTAWFSWSEAWVNATLNCGGSDGLSAVEGFGHTLQTPAGSEVYAHSNGTVDNETLSLAGGGTMRR